MKKMYCILIGLALQTAVFSGNAAEHARPADVDGVRSGAYRLTLDDGQLNFGKEGSATPYFSVMAVPDNDAAVGGPARLLERSDTAARIIFPSGEKSVEIRAEVLDDGTLTIHPAGGAFALDVSMRMDFAVVPSRWADCTIYNPEKYAGTNSIAAINDNVLMALAGHGERIVYIGWPRGGQKIGLFPDNADKSAPIFGKARITFDGRRVVLRPTEMKGIWHRQKYTPDQLEKDIRTDWKPPYPAKWVMQFVERDLPSNYTFVQGRQVANRPGLGRYVHPMWIEKNGTASFHFSRRLDATANNVAYALEGHKATPYEFLRSVLTKDERQDIYELRPYQKLGNVLSEGLPLSVWHSACRGRDQMRATLLKTGRHYREREFLKNYIDFKRAFAVANEEVHSGRWLECITRLKAQVAEFRAAQKDDPPMLEYVGELEKIVNELEARFVADMDGKTAREHIAEYNGIGKKWMALIDEAGDEYEVEMMHYLNKLNSALSRTEKIGCWCGTTLRKLFQESAYRAAKLPAAHEYAAVLRDIVRGHLAIRRWETRVEPEKDLR